MSKGSRPIGVVSSVEGLALKVGTGHLLEVWDTRGVGRFLRDEADKAC